DLQQVDGVEAIVAELNLGDGPAARVGNAHRHADDPALIEGRVPGGLEALCGGKDASQWWPDILAEDVGDAEARLTVVKCQTNSLYERGHRSRKSRVVPRVDDIDRARRVGVALYIRRRRLRLAKRLLQGCVGLRLRGSVDLVALLARQHARVKEL